MRARFAVLALAPSLAISACAPADLPRDRLGCLPFPGTFTLFERADPADLGRHHYAEWDNLTDGFAERERGVLYTCRAGFIDLAHVRETIDWARFMQLHVARALEDADAGLVIHGREHTRWNLSFSYPPGWAALPASERRARTEAAASAVALRMAYIVMTWHEIITWFGYKSTVLIPEDRSAFTYDDVAAHAVGLLVADRAMNNAPRIGWDKAVTDALRAVLEDLAVATPDVATEAIERVRGVWWKDGDCLLRTPEFNPDKTTFTPHLVPDFSPCTSVAATPIPLPAGRSLDALDLRAFVRVTLRSGVLEMSDIRRAAGRSAREPLEVAQDFPKLIEHIRAASTPAK